MADEIEFPKGLIVKKPRDGAPDFVKASISIKREELIEWLSSKDGDWINLDVKEAKSGHWYASVNTFKPKAEPVRVSNDSQMTDMPDIPF